MIRARDLSVLCRVFACSIFRVIQVEQLRYTVYKIKFGNSFESEACSQYFTGSGYCDYLCIGNTLCTEQFHFVNFCLF